MINDINKLLFLDIETVGIEEDLDSLHVEFPHLSKMWKETGYDYCKRRYPNEDLYSNEMFIKKAALLPEFGKIVCVSVGFIIPSGEIKLDSFVGDEKEILGNVCELFNRVDKLGFRICGHNIKNFDLPYIGLSSLDLICASLGIDSPKSGDLKGDLLHQFYYSEKNDISKIKTYCENDVTATIELVKKIT